MHELDWFVKHRRPANFSKIPNFRKVYYLRYVDDTVLLAETSEQLKEWRNAIKDFLEKKLKLNLHPKKTIIQPTRYGIDFLGYIVTDVNLEK